MLKAVPRQTLASTADQMAMSGSESQATGGSAAALRMPFRKP